MGSLPDLTSNLLTELVLAWRSFKSSQKSSGRSALHLNLEHAPCTLISDECLAHLNHTSLHYLQGPRGVRSWSMRILFEAFNCPTIWQPCSTFSLSSLQREGFGSSNHLTYISTMLFQLSDCISRACWSRPSRRCGQSMKQEAVAWSLQLVHASQQI
jgi:hypothetical protein